MVCMMLKFGEDGRRYVPNRNVAGRHGVWGKFITFWLVDINQVNRNTRSFFSLESEVVRSPKIYEAREPTVILNWNILTLNRIE